MCLGLRAVLPGQSDIRKVSPVPLKIHGVGGNEDEEVHSVGFDANYDLLWLE